MYIRVVMYGRQYERLTDGPTNARLFTAMRGPRSTSAHSRNMFAAVGRDLWHPIKTWWQLFLPDVTCTYIYIFEAKNGKKWRLRVRIYETERDKKEMFFFLSSFNELERYYYYSFVNLASPSPRRRSDRLIVSGHRFIFLLRTRTFRLSFYCETPSVRVVAVAVVDDDDVIGFSTRAKLSLNMHNPLRAGMTTVGQPDLLSLPQRLPRAASNRVRDVFARPTAESTQGLSVDRTACKTYYYCHCQDQRREHFAPPNRRRNIRYRT